MKTIRERLDARTAFRQKMKEKYPNGPPRVRIGMQIDTIFGRLEIGDEITGIPQARVDVDVGSALAAHLVGRTEAGEDVGPLGAA